MERCSAIGSSKLASATPLLGREPPGHLLGWCALRLQASSGVPLGVEPLADRVGIRAAQNLFAIGSLERWFLKCWPTILVLRELLVQPSVVGLQVIFVGGRHVIEEYRVLVVAVPRHVRPVVHLVERLVEWHFL